MITTRILRISELVPGQAVLLLDQTSVEVGLPGEGVFPVQFSAEPSSAPITSLLGKA